MWEKDADRKPTGVYDWTSLTGADKKKLLSMLPEKLPEILPPDITPTIVQIWKVCYIVLDNFRNSSSQNPPPSLNNKVNQISLIRTHAVTYLLYILCDFQFQQDFEALYKLLSKWDLTEEEKETVHTKARTCK